MIHVRTNVGILRADVVKENVRTFWARLRCDGHIINRRNRDRIEPSGSTIERREDRMEKVWIWIARRLPRGLSYWAAMMILAYATTGKYSKTVAPEITALEALERWRKRE